MFGRNSFAQGLFKVAPGCRAAFAVHYGPAAREVPLASVGAAHRQKFVCRSRQALDGLGVERYWVGPQRVFKFEAAKPTPGLWPRVGRGPVPLGLGAPSLARMKRPNPKGQVAQVVGAGREDFLVEGQGGAVFAYEQGEFRIEVPTVDGFGFLAANARHIDLCHRAVALG